MVKKITKELIKDHIGKRNYVKDFKAFLNTNNIVNKFGREYSDAHIRTYFSCDTKGTNLDEAFSDYAQPMYEEIFSKNHLRKENKQLQTA